MSYWGDPNISNLSGSFGSLMQRKGEQGGKEGPRERGRKGRSTNGRKEEKMEEEEKETEGERKKGGGGRGKGGGGGFSDLGEKLSKFLQANYAPKISDF